MIDVLIQYLSGPIFTACNDPAILAVMSTSGNSPVNVYQFSTNQTKPPYVLLQQSSEAGLFSPIVELGRKWQVTSEVMNIRCVAFGATAGDAVNRAAYLVQTCADVINKKRDNILQLNRLGIGTASNTAIDKIDSFELRVMPPTNPSGPTNNDGDPEWSVVHILKIYAIVSRKSGQA